jgi:nicotinamidase/pyrazinamidase
MPATTSPALILVDIQNDFLPGGNLAVPRGDEVVPIANALIPHFPLVIATQDWHPSNHGSFASQHPGKKPGELITLNGLSQVLWPDHCIQHSRGAEFAPTLNRAGIQHIIHKGTDPAIDSYSGFFDNGHKKATGLHDLLQRHRITELAILGLATDYCVRFTALDARKLGYTVNLIQDGCRGVNLNPTDSQSALEEMARAGVRLASSADFRKPARARG